MDLNRRLEQRRQDQLTPLREQRSGEDRREAAQREPEWVRRAKAAQLPTKARWAA